jgi:hypothetical protein
MKTIREIKKVKAGRGNTHIDVDKDAFDNISTGPGMEKKHGILIRSRGDDYILRGQKKGIVSFVTTELGWTQQDIKSMWPDLLTDK